MRIKYILPVNLDEQNWYAVPLPFTSAHFTCCHYYVNRTSICLARDLKKVKFPCHRCVVCVCVRVSARARQQRINLMKTQEIFLYEVRIRSVELQNIQIVLAWPLYFLHARLTCILYCVAGLSVILCILFMFAERTLYAALHCAASHRLGPFRHKTTNGQF